MALRAMPGAHNKNRCHRRGRFGGPTLPFSTLLCRQQSHALEMLRLREKIEGLHRIELIIVFDKKLQIANLRRRVARNIDNPFRPKCEKLPEKELVRSFSWRINDYRCFLRRKGHALKNRRRITGKECAVFDAI